MRYKQETYVKGEKTAFFTRIYWSAPEDSDREKIVLVPGLGMSGAYMQPLAEDLSDSYTVYVPELPGFGRSPKPPQALSISELTDALHNWAKAFPVRRAWYFGNSAGCQIIAGLAVHYSHLIKGAVLQGPVIDPHRRNAATQLLLFAKLAAYEPSALIAILLRDYFKSGIKRIMKTFNYSLQYKIEDYLPLMKVPAVVIWGENDKLISQQWAEEAAALLPDGRLIKVRDEAHTLNYTAPRLMANITAEFIDSNIKKEHKTINISG